MALAHTNITAAAGVLERLWCGIAGLEKFSVASITFSMGAAEWRPGVDLDAAIKQARITLYEAKEAGRSQLVAVTQNQALDGTGSCNSALSIKTLSVS